MHELAFLSLGIAIGSFVTAALISLMRQAHAADEWGESLRDNMGETKRVVRVWDENYDPNPTPYDYQQDTGHPFADPGYRIRRAP